MTIHHLDLGQTGLTGCWGDFLELSGARLCQANNGTVCKFVQ